MHSCSIWGSFFHIRALRGSLRGESDARITAAFGIDLAALTALRKSARYKRVEQRLAEQILTAASGRLQALAAVAVDKLESIVQIPAKNQTRNGQRRADPALLKEQRLTAQALLTLALKVKERTDEERRERELEAQLASLEGGDDDSLEE